MLLRSLSGLSFKSAVLACIALQHEAVSLMRLLVRMPMLQNDACHYTDSISLLPCCSVTRLYWLQGSFAGRSLCVSLDTAVKMSAGSDPESCAGPCWSHADLESDCTIAR